MNYVRKTYIEFLYATPIFRESSIKEVRGRDLSKVKVPKGALGFKFFDILSMVVEADGGQVELTSRRINESPMHYYGGKLYTVAELKHEFPNEHILIDNFEYNNHKLAIRCRTGNLQPFEEGAIFVKEIT